MTNTPIQATSSQEPQDNDEIDLLGMLGTLIDHKKLILGITTTCFVGGLAYSLIATPIYKATALIQVEKKSSGLTGLDDLGAALGKESKSVTEIELIKSRTVIGKAVDRLQLDMEASPIYFPMFGKYIARRFERSNTNSLNDAPLGLNSYAWGGEKIALTTLKVSESLLDKPLTLLVIDNNSYQLLDSDANEILRGKPGETARLNDNEINVNTLIARPGTRFNIIKNRRLDTILRYQADLEISEKSKDSGILSLALNGSDAKETEGILDQISQQFVRQNIERNAAEAANSLVFLREQLPGVQADLEHASTQLNTYQKQARSVDITGETQGILQTSVSTEEKLTGLRLQQAELERRFTRQHPTYQALQKQIDELEHQRKQISEKIHKLPETQQEVLKLTRDVQVGTEIYSKVLNKIQELDVVRAGTIGNARIIDTAAVDLRAPVAPKKSLIIIFSTIIGALLASSLVLLRRSLNRGVDTPEEIEKTGLPVYATIPLSDKQSEYEKILKKEEGAKASDIPLLAANYPTDLAIEALRSLRTSLHFAMLEAKNNCIMISGPGPNVGKSFISANLAAIIAQAGQRVLLIDCDLRKGNIHLMFNIPPENKGLSNLLAREGTVAECIIQTSIPGLSFIPRGKIPPNPSELLMHPNFADFLDSVCQEFDLVLIDTPPLLAVTDAAIVGRLAGTSLIVTRFARNSVSEIQLTVRRFAQNGIAIKGAIFNGLEKRASVYGRYGGYGYGYGGYSYYQYDYKSDSSDHRQ